MVTELYEFFEVRNRQQDAKALLSLALDSSLNAPDSLRARAFAQRPLIEDASVEGEESFLVNAAIGWRTRQWEIALECLNVFDREDNDIEYFYGSRLAGEADEGFDDVHLHPTEPRMFRVRATYRF